LKNLSEALKGKPVTDLAIDLRNQNMGDGGGVFGAFKKGIKKKSSN
jgi:hypothetical protein